jgi:hypothetical protein
MHTAAALADLNTHRYTCEGSGGFCDAGERISCSPGAYQQAFPMRISVLAYDVLTARLRTPPTKLVTSGTSTVVLRGEGRSG